MWAQAITGRRALVALFVALTLLVLLAGPATFRGGRPALDRGDYRARILGRSMPSEPQASDMRSGRPVRSGVGVISGRSAPMDAGASLAGGASAIPLVPPSSSTDGAILEECRERFVIVPGEEMPVSERVPDEYELARDGSGRPLLYVSAIRCERYTVDDTTEPTTVAAFGAMIQSPDGVGCASRWPLVGAVKGDLLSCNIYLLFAAYDNPAVVEWFLDGTPELPVHHVDDLEFRQADLDPASLGAPFRFRAGPTTPSPYQIEAVVRERPAESPMTATFWATTSAGTVRVRFESDDFAFGEADGTLRPAPGSEMAELLGSASPKSASGLSLIAGNRWRYGEITKELLSPHP